MRPPLAAFAHQDLPFEEIAQSFERERGLRPAALANTMILLQNAALRPTVGSGHTLSFRGGQSEHAVAASDDRKSLMLS